MAQFALTGDDPFDATPRLMREIRFGQGPAGGVAAERPVVIFCNKVAGTGTTLLDGKGSPLDVPVAIFGGESEVIERAGYHSEALNLWKVYRLTDKVSLIYLCILTPGTGTGTGTFTFVNAATITTNLVVEALGETVKVQVPTTTSVTDICVLARDLINAQLHWPFVASANVGELTVANTMAGLRHDYLWGRLRMRWEVSGSATTITKSAITPSSTEDDMTSALAALALFNLYYQVNPKGIVVGATPTDNGIGEHAAAMNTLVSANGDKQCIMIFGMCGTISQAITTMISVNQNFAYGAWSENSDWSPGMHAAEYSAIMSYAELTNRAPNLAGYGARVPTEIVYAPDKYDKNDRPTQTEIKAAFNNGITPICFTSTGKAHLKWHVTGRSETNSIKDYRCRPGHITSVMYTVWEVLSNEARSTQQPNIMPDPLAGQARKPFFNTPSDYVSLVRRVIDILTDNSVCILDPGAKQYMKDSVVVDLLVSGVIVDCDWRAVRHNLQQRFRLNETSPSI